jgi:hypothetical protein
MKYNLKMSLKADDIEKIVAEILSFKNIFPRNKLDDLYLDFRTKNRMFYEMIMDNQFDTEIFKEMMKAKRKLEAGQDQYSVDTQFGKFMADKFITPALEKKDQGNAGTKREGGVLENAENKKNKSS